LIVSRDDSRETVACPLTSQTVMPYWLVDDPSVLYVLLGVIALGLVVGLGLKREGQWLKIWLLSLLVVAVLIGVVIALDALVVTDGEKIVTTLEQMTEAVKKRDTSGIMNHVSKDFEARSLNRAGLEDRIKFAFSQGVDEVVIFDIEPIEVPSGSREAKVRFTAKAKQRGSDIADPRGYQVEATFVLEGDEWRMKTFLARDPQDNRVIFP
jgi:hypothetical protein